jgi:anaphase-promoting complex subunit 6
MFTPPGIHPDSSSLSFSPLPINVNPRRRLPTRSSLSNSFSFAPHAPDPVHDLSTDGESSFSFSGRSAPTRSNQQPRSSGPFSPATLRNVVDQGNRGMAQVSPRARPSPSSGRTNGSTRTVVPRDSAAPRTRSRLADDSSPEPRRSPRRRVQNDEAEEAEDEEERTWSMVDSMRLWRHDAIMQHLYETAAFWGDKVLSWTGTCDRPAVSVRPNLTWSADPNDAFWLAQTHFLTGNYLRAERLLTECLPPPPRNMPPRSKGSPAELAWKGKGKGKSRESEDESMESIANGHVFGIAATGREEERIRGRLVDESLACRYLAAQCLVRTACHSLLTSLGSSREVSRGARAVGRV